MIVKGYVSMNIIHVHYMSNIQKSIDFINKAYDKLTYFDLYGASVFICALLIYLLVLYYQFMRINQNFEPVRRNWTSHRCNPIYMPFAGYIMRPKNISWVNFAGNNATYCVNQILQNIAGNFMKPIYFILYPILGMWKMIIGILQAIRKIFIKIRNAMANIVANIMNRVASFIIILQKMVMSLKDLFAKIRGIFVAGIYTALGGYYAVKSALGALLVLCIIFLVSLAAMIMIAWMMPWTWAVAAALTVLFVAIMIPLAYTTTWMAIIMDIKPKDKPPGKPGRPGGCFRGDTPIKLQDGSIIQIKNVRHGDVLEDGGIVTAFMIYSNSDNVVGKLDNIYVTREHYVMHDGTWKMAQSHPEFMICDNEENDKINEVYCLGVSTKKIHIGNHVFADWDDMIKPGEVYNYNKQLLHLPMNVNIEGSELYNGKHIHSFFEGGFNGNTMVSFKDSSSRKISEICIGDILDLGNIVIGLVIIDGRDISQYKTIVYGSKKVKYEIQGAGNNIYKQNGSENVFNINKSTLDEFLDKDELNTHEKDNILYHLITTHSNFVINGGLTVGDYNSCLDYFETK